MQFSRSWTARKRSDYRLAGSVLATGSELARLKAHIPTWAGAIPQGPQYRLIHPMLQPRHRIDTRNLHHQQLLVATQPHSFLQPAVKRGPRQGLPQYFQRASPQGLGLGDGSASASSIASATASQVQETAASTSGTGASGCFFSQATSRKA